MLIAAVLCLCAAAATAALGAWSLLRPRTADPVDPTGTVANTLRAVAPTQLAAATMLAAGGVVALAAAHSTAVLALVVCVVGAVGTVAAGCYQSAKAVALGAQGEATAGCGGACASCTLSCS